MCNLWFVTRFGQVVTLGRNRFILMLTLRRQKSTEEYAWYIVDTAAAT